MDITDSLHQHISKYIHFSQENFTAILPYFQVMETAKKEVLMEAGTLCRSCYFVLKGCLQLYYVSEKGAEKTLQFAIENWWLSDFLAFHHRQHTDFYIRAVEPTQVICLTYENQASMLEAFPVLEGYFRNVYQIAYGASLMRVKFLFDYSKEEIYFHFTRHFPEFAQRVPQYMLASYLGLTPEYVSEIRRKLS